ncbi:DUF3990 domain-containing protein, partial [Microbulbifer rhizosphaerae]
YNREAIRNIALQLSGDANDETLIAHHATYNAFGETVASIDNNGNATLYEYDQRGNVVKELKPEADVHDEQMNSFRAHTATEYGVNAFGEKVMEKVGVEAGAGATTATKNAVNAYNLLHEQIRLQDYQAGLLMASQDGEGYYDTQAYDQAGNLKGSSQLAYRVGERGAGTSALYYQVAYHYDANNQLVRMNRFQDGTQAIDYAFGGLVPSYDEWDYDEFGNRIRHRNALYGETNKILSASFDSTGVASNSGTIGQETYRYDGMGRVLQYKSYSGQITDYAYAWTDAMTRNVLAADGQQAQGPADQVQLGGYITSIAKAGMGGIVDTDWNQSSQEDVLSDAVDYFGKAVWHDDLGGHRIEYAYNYAGWLSRQTGNTALSGNATWETRNNQDIRYTYYHNGNLFRTYDYGNNGLADGDQTAANSGIAPAVTEYRYDKAGNRTGELYYRSNDLYNNLGRVVYQHSTAQYDEQGRIHSIEGYDEYGNAYQIDYTFDAFGNRRSVSSVYDGRYVDNLDGTIQGKTQSFYYTYDKNNRFTLTLGEFENGQIVLGKTGTAITYNGLDQRYLATRASDGSIREKYAYDANGRLAAVYIDQGGVDEQGEPIGFKLRGQRINNDAGQVTAYFEYDSAGKRYSITQNYHNADGTLLGYQTTRYDENGLATDEVTRSRNTFLGDGQTVNTTVTSAYPEDGGAATVTTLYNSYEKWDTYKTKSVVISADNKDLAWEQRANWENGEAYYTYDSNGHIRRVYDVEGERAIAYVTDKEGRTLVREEINDSGQSALGREMRHFYYFNGHAVGDVGNDKVPSRFDYVKALADAEGAGNRHLNDNGDHVQAVQSADFDQNFQPINPNYPASSYSSYEAQGGETLQSIAAMVWGDASLWYLLADANGLKGDEVLTKGQRIEMPNVVTNIHNNADTFRPVDGALQMGDTSPTLPDVPPPPPADDGCGAVGIIVLVVAAVISGGAALAAYAAVSGAIGAIGALGAFAGVTGFVAGVAAAGIVSQAIMQTGAIVAGYQDGYSFSWRDVAKDGLIAAATFGIGELAGVGDKTKGLADAKNGLAAAQQTKNAAEIARYTNQIAKMEQSLRVTRAVVAGASSIASQGVNKAFDSEYEFKWESVATSVVGSYASDWVMGETPAGEWGSSVQVVTSSAITAGVRKLTENESFDWANVLNDAVGNSIGNTIGSGIAEKINAWGYGQSGQAPLGEPTEAGAVAGAEKTSSAEQRLTEQTDAQMTSIDSSWGGKEGALETVTVTASMSDLAAKGDYWSFDSIMQRQFDVYRQAASYNDRLDEKLAGYQRRTEQARASVQATWDNFRAGVAEAAANSHFGSVGGTDFAEEVAAYQSYSEWRLPQIEAYETQFGPRNNVGEWGKDLLDITATMGGGGARFALESGTDILGLAIEGSLMFSPLARSQWGGSGFALSESIKSWGMEQAAGMEPSPWSGGYLSEELQTAYMGASAIIGLGELTAVSKAGVLAGVRRVPNDADDFVTFYHGTSPESASQIRLNGIDLAKSKPLNDFGDGFYMTTSRADAIESAKMVNLNQEVLEFRVPKSELDNLNILKFDYPNQEWADFVSINKQLDVPYLPPKEWSPTGFDIVEGPLFRGMRRDGTLRNWVERADQTSIHTDVAAELFNRYLVQ